jgi:hypothetical protein
VPVLTHYGAPAECDHHHVWCLQCSVAILAIMEGGRPGFFGKYTTSNPADDSRLAGGSLLFLGWLLVGWHESLSNPA